MSHSVSRAWCFTLNNPGNDEYALVQRYQEYGGTYVVGQFERGHADDTRHFQGYAYFKSPKSLRTLKGWLPRAHWEIAKGSPEENKAYCTKEDTRIEVPIELGIFPQKGRRSDLSGVSAKIASGSTAIQIFNEYPEAFIRYRTGILGAISMLSQNLPRSPPVIIVLYGPSGTGKTRSVQDFSSDLYWKPDGEWWDGYKCQECIVLDEFHGQYPFHLLLRLFDRYPFSVPIKGGFVSIQSKFILVTSNLRPRQWYKREIDMGPLQRRLAEFGTVYYCTLDGDRDNDYTYHYPFFQLKTNLDELFM